VCFVVEPVEIHRGPHGARLRLSDVDDLTPGHAAQERAPET
jgi:hypothetical protein